MKKHGRGLNNKQRTILIHLNGKTKTISEWAEELGIKKGTIHSRLARGCSPEQTLDPREGHSIRTNYHRKDNRLIEYMGETKPLYVWARECGIKSVTLSFRLAHGWPVEKALTHKVRKCERHDGLSVKHPIEFYLWHAMRNRCMNKNSKKWKDYGGRGIRVCKTWSESFGAFLRDMGSRPSGKHTLDREDNDGSYCAANCRWATRKQQMRNTRRSHKVSLNGETLCITEWAERAGMAAGLLWARLKAGWDIDVALSTPIGGIYGPHRKHSADPRNGFTK